MNNKGNLKILNFSYINFKDKDVDYLCPGFIEFISQSLNRLKFWVLLLNENELERGIIYCCN